jgi:hypothetical protein
VVVAAVFRGDVALMRALLEAVERNCTCAPRGITCPCHRALLDQRYLDALLFYRWMRERLVAEELR